MQMHIACTRSRQRHLPPLSPEGDQAPAAVCSLQPYWRQPPGPTKDVSNCCARKEASTSPSLTDQARNRTHLSPKGLMPLQLRAFMTSLWNSMFIHFCPATELT